MLCLKKDDTIIHFSIHLKGIKSIEYITLNKAYTWNLFCVLKWASHEIYVNLFEK